MAFEPPPPSGFRKLYCNFFQKTFEKKLLQDWLFMIFAPPQFINLDSYLYQNGKDTHLHFCSSVSFRIIGIRNCLRAQEHANLNAKTFCPMCRLSNFLRHVLLCEFWIVIKKGQTLFCGQGKTSFHQLFFGPFLVLSIGKYTEYHNNGILRISKYSNYVCS